ncbi:Nif3-like dinuclear metal center hexameric protein [Nakamurella antarctica]|uniref:GTP cyclohydrolase 1 type 2 homolog n=1 Tax=Nakamurella antarctica TaxID=1902245 RepID=A0A3G8ZVR4_9ACTN|nr:Nif3-like dinuclear metal center hexameric protein [Nakamurella antarctica]AZI57761.1 Nif3-like dinuclear metal center hexameric protein [Nakamurella antarctica]
MTSPPVLLADIIDVLQQAYPPALAQSWDTAIGLTCGDPSVAVTKVLLAVDVDSATVGEAIDSGAGLLLTHHPLLFAPVQSVAADTEKGALIHQLIRAGVAHFAAHTNADSAAGGVNDALAQALGLREICPLQPSPDLEDLSVRDTVGMGRTGFLATPVTMQQLVEVVARVLPACAGGVNGTGDPARLVHKVAVCGGSGSSLLGRAAEVDADVFLTSDVSHHLSAEYVAVPGNPALITVAHWAGEWPWLPLASRVLTEAFPGRLEVCVSTLRTDAWTIHQA